MFLESSQPSYQAMESRFGEGKLTLREVRGQGSTALPRLCVWKQLLRGSIILKHPTFFPVLVQEENKDFVPSSRRKPFGSSEQLARAETPRKRPDARLEATRQLSDSKAEERRRWTKGCSEDN